MSRAPAGAPEAGAKTGGALVRFTGPALAAATLALAALLHHGLGPGEGARWLEPSGFLLRVFPSDLGAALAVGVLPAVALCIAVFATTGAAVPRTLAVTGVIAATCFVFYGVGAPGVWSFFEWRWSACMILFAAIVGLSVSAPLLAAEWRRRGWTLRALAYLPVAAFLVAFERNVTGTDPTLAFSISPWPAVQILGLELTASFVAALLLGCAAGVFGVAQRRALPLLLGAVAAVALPLAIVWGGSRGGLLPFALGPGFATLCVVLALVLLAAMALPVRADPARARQRAAHLALGALLLGLPLATGQLLARLDYTATRDGSARRVIDALASYYEREERYPEELDELVEAGLLERVPRPQIGFGDDQHFAYQNLGSDYLLEFSATRWIQCAYNPPWQDEALVGEEDAEETLGGSWSCPTNPPELW